MKNAHSRDRKSYWVEAGKLFCDYIEFVSKVLSKKQACHMKFFDSNLFCFFVFLFGRIFLRKILRNNF